MTSREKKERILEILQQEGPLHLQQLLERLGSDFAERSVRRWLQEFIGGGLVESSGKSRATKFAAVKAEERKSREPFSEESARIIQETRRPLYERTPVSYAIDWVHSYVPNRTSYLSSPLLHKMRQYGERCRKEDPAGTYAHQIFDRLLIDLSYNSSRLEGNTYSLLDTQRLLSEGKRAEGKLEEDAVMIINHKEAIRYLVNNAAKLMPSKETIYTLHYLLSDGLVEPHEAGKIRTHEVRIGGSTYMPYERPQQLEEQLSAILDKAAQIQNPYEQSFFLLLHISYLQCFSDVNKRTARLAANIPLIKNNLVPLSFNDVGKDDYTSALIAIYELQKTRPLADLFYYSYMRTAALYEATVRAIGFDEVRVRFRGQRRTLLRHIIVMLMKGREMQEYIAHEADRLIPERERAAFIEDALQDLRELDISRIAGLGISKEELAAWMDLSS